VSNSPKPYFQQLPYDVIEVIARCLSKEALVPEYRGARAALARLNSVSKAVHEITLPALYETTEYFTEADFNQTVKLENPKGWKYTK
jgi:hypothetical protein